MEIKLLKNFLQIARLGNMTKASQMLYISQSALSKQMKELEEEFGCNLFIRQKEGMVLTEEGYILRKRAEDIVSLFEKTKQDFEDLDKITGGDIHVGAAETCHMDIFARELLTFRKDYPNLRCHIISGMTEQVTQMLDRGLLDIAIISGQPNIDKYNHIRYPAEDQWGAVVAMNHPLASAERLTINELKDYNLMMSTQGLSEEILRWCGQYADLLNVSDTVNLAYNGSVFVKENVAVLLSYKGLANTSEENNLRWIPLYPKLTTPLYVIWRKYQVFTPIVDLFFKQLLASFENANTKNY
ncbi:MAG: LysR family transcriptional regulator [Succinivibrio dextrinosolvens]|nr:LysR family transcriptional regulator [Succinivibrio dextrinosolvens]MDY6420123.1 LysR family transcriptional regulator [Succinivibrio dextrinosolvens]